MKVFLFYLLSLIRVLVSLAQTDSNQFIGDKVPGRIVKRQTRSSISCILPPLSADKTFTVQCPDAGRCSNRPGDKVPNFAHVVYHCNPGYTREDGDSFVSSCFNGQWSLKNIKCSKICKPLKSVNMHLTCHGSRFEIVNCSGNLFEGTSVIPRCHSPYHPQTTVEYSKIICLPNGEWSDVLYKCIPDCGIPFYPNTTQLIAHGRPERFGDSPWHVAVYNLAELISGQPALVCGGTIISPRLVLSAAHCFFDEIAQKPFDKNNYEIAVSKMTRDYNTKDNGQTRIYKIQELIFSNVGYYGASANHAADIILLRIAEKITLSAVVLPACVDWTANDHFAPKKNTIGKLVGWGANETDDFSDTLRTADLPVISYNDCVAQANEDFRNIIIPDKFCAGTHSGPGARPGDSGGGLVFRDQRTDLFYLRGIVSIRDSAGGSIALFTDIAVYINWITEVRRKVEGEETPSKIKQEEEDILNQLVPVTTQNYQTHAPTNPLPPKPPKSANDDPIDLRIRNDEVCPGPLGAPCYQRDKSWNSSFVLPVIETRYTTSVYFTTYYRDRSSTIVSHTETITNYNSVYIKPMVTQDMLRSPTPALNFPVTYTYRTAYIDNGQVVATNHLETVFNSKPIVQMPVFDTRIIAPTPVIDLTETFTHYTTLIGAGYPVVHSRYETKIHSVPWNPAKNTNARIGMPAELISSINDPDLWH